MVLGDISDVSRWAFVLVALAIIGLAWGPTAYANIHGFAHRVVPEHPDRSLDTLLAELAQAERKIGELESAMASVSVTDLLDRLEQAERELGREKRAADLESEALTLRYQQAERERDEWERIAVERGTRMHLIISTIYTTHGYLDAEGEIDTAAKFRAVERLARIDWDTEGYSRVV